MPYLQRIEIGAWMSNCIPMSDGGLANPLKYLSYFRKQIP